VKSKKLKIAVLGTRGPCTAGGIQTICMELYPLLVNDFDVTIYTRAPYVDPKLKDFKGIRLIHLPTVHNKFLEATVHTFLATLHAVFSDADILHFNAQGPSIFMPLAKLLAPNKKIAFTCHGIDWQRAKWGGPASWLIRWGEWCSARFSNGLIGISKEMIAHYQKQYQRQMTHIPNGTWLFDHKPAKLITEQFGLQPRQYLLSMGRLVPEKAVHDTITAYKTIPKDQRNGCPLVIVGRPVGTGNYQKELEALAGDDPDIIFTGFAAGDLRDELLTNARCYVSASHLEGLPLTVLQALAAGLPLVLSDIPPHVEASEDKTHSVVDVNQLIQYFPTGNTQALTAQLTQALQVTPQQVETIASQAKQFIEQYYLWPPITEQYKTFYQQL